MFRKLILTLLSVLMLAFGLIASTNPSYAANVIVVDSLDDHTHWTGTCSLRDAIVSANSDDAQDGCEAGNGADAIEFSAELTGRTVALNGAPLVVFDDLTIVGDLTIDAQYRSRILTLENGATLTLDGLTLMHGRADYGGALYISRGHATLRNIVFDRNQALADGGAIESIDALSTLHVTSSRFTRNQAGRLGGAIDLYNTQGVIHNSEFAHNSADVEGGAISVINSKLSSSDNTYRYNHARFGGALCSVDSQLVMHNDNIYENHATVLGGAVVASGGNFQLFGSVVGRNISENDGGAVGLVNGTDAYISSTVLHDNQAAQFGGGVHNQGGKLFMGSVSFYWNSAERGSGFYQQTGETQLSRTTFDGDVAQWDGGIVQNVE